MKKKLNNEYGLCMVAFLFDIGEIKESLYGEKIFEYIIKGNELVDNMCKVVISEGDILDREIYEDITPFVINDKLCTVDKSYKKYNDYIFAILIEDIEFNIAKKIDSRIKEEFSSYLGMTSIDINSTDIRKQFWKMLIRSYSIEETTLTYFGYEGGGFSYSEKAEEYGFKINYDGFPDEIEDNNRLLLFSTRQSSFISRVKQLEIKIGRNDFDRGILEMNFYLVKEVEIAGVQIWKGIEDINRVYIPKSDNRIIVDYLFTSLYQVSQGIERLFKILIQLMDYDMNYNESSYDRKKTYNLLLSHNHVAMYEFLYKHKKLSLEEDEKNFLELIFRFYNRGRYNRFIYSENNMMELKLLQDFGNDIEDEQFDNRIKHRYGKTIGKISRKLYYAISEISTKLNIYVYELNNDSVARFVLNDYYKYDLYQILKDIENSRREFIWYLLKEGKNIPITIFEDEIEALHFYNGNVNMFLEELISNINSGSSIYDFVLNEYYEQEYEDKEKWKERLNFIELISNPSMYFIADKFN